MCKHFKCTKANRLLCTKSKISELMVVPSWIFVCIFPLMFKMTNVFFHTWYVGIKIETISHYQSIQMNLICYHNLFLSWNKLIKDPNKVFSQLLEINSIQITKNAQNNILILNCTFALVSACILLMVSPFFPITKPTISRGTGTCHRKLLSCN